MESEERWNQNSAPSNAIYNRNNCWDEASIQVKVQRLHGQRDENMAGTWNKSYEMYFAAGGLTNI